MASGAPRELDPRAQILDFIRREGSATVEELAALLGLSITPARAHVAKLEFDGLVARERATPEGPGRPRVRFRLSVAGTDLFPTEDADILARLLSFLKAEDAEGLVVRFFEDLWDERFQQFEASLSGPGAPLPERLTCLERLLVRGHFMPDIESTPAAAANVVTVRECNCPLPSAARATRVPCRLEMDFLARAIGGRSVAARVASTRLETCDFSFVVDGRGTSSGAAPAADGAPHGATT